jgi:hypothetical protein
LLFVIMRWNNNKFRCAWNIFFKMNNNNKHKQYCTKEMNIPFRVASELVTQDSNPIDGAA